MVSIIDYRMIGLRKKIKIIDVNPEKDENGLMKPNTIVLFFGWAEVTNPSSFRNFLVGQDSMDFTKLFKIRNQQPITTNVNTRLIYSGKTYTVNSIEKDEEKNFYWNIRATAKDGGTHSGWTPATTFNLLTEDDDTLITEDGDNLITEDG